MSEVIWKHNIEALRIHNFMAADALMAQEKTTLVVGVDEVCDKRVLYAIKDDLTYQMDTLYDSDELMDMWFQNLPKIYFRSKVLMYGLGNGMYVDSFHPQFSCF